MKKLLVVLTRLSSIGAYVVAFLIIGMARAASIHLTEGESFMAFWAWYLAGMLFVWGGCLLWNSADNIKFGD